MQTANQYDLVLYGATGFTGRRAAAYLDAHPDAPSLRWAIAARNADKLKRVQDTLTHCKPDLLVADSADPEAVHAMVKQARVIANTAGPFALYGTPVVAACVEYGVDYVDITGESPWFRELIDQFHEAAVSKGVRIIPCCGYDSVPSDLGVWMMVDWIRRNLNEETRAVRASFPANTELNGGGVASILNIAEKGQNDLVNDPVLLSPPPFRTDVERLRNPDMQGIEYDSDLGCWLSPSLMALINERVVRRSVGLFEQYGQSYGSVFRYQECQEEKSRLHAYASSIATAILIRLVSTSTGRKLASRFGPKPGEGPSEEEIESGSFTCRLVAETAAGQKVQGTVIGQGDPGNACTVLMLIESALALAKQRDALPGGVERGGILTPATGLGDVLLERLRQAGMQWRVQS